MKNAKESNCLGFVPQFYIEKEGVTLDRVLIVQKDGEPFDFNKKVHKYLVLGYTVYSLSGNQITAYMKNNNFIKEVPTLTKGFKNAGEVLQYWATGCSLFYKGEKIEYFKPAVRTTAKEMIAYSGIYFKLYGKDGLYVADCNEIEYLKYI